jgi:hypothetical protein
MLARASVARFAPLLAGVLTALAVLVVWGSLDPVPVMHDEWAYWLQADQYARLRWSEPSPTIPEFFEQLYVLVTPVFAAKYWPGHAIALAPGFAVGLPALMPLVLTALTGALMFALARRTAGARVAVVAWVLWVGAFGNLRFRAAYFSEITTSFAWLAAWWALLEWRRTRQLGWMVALSAVTGWGAVTRPATMFVFALPVGAVVLRDAWRARTWRHVGAGLAVGTLVLGLLPLWSARVTGDWRTTPLALYTRQYLPFDVPGYTVSATPPERALPPEMERVRGFLRDIKHDQAGAPAWRTFADRAGLLLRDAFDGWRLPFAAAFAVGLVTAGAAGWFAIGSDALLVLAYLAQAHTADWTVYYLEAMPAVAYVSALGVERFLAWPARRGATTRWSARLVLPLGAVAAVLLAIDVARARGVLARVSAQPRAFRAAVARLPRRPNIVFVRYAQRRNMHLALVANRGVLASADTWIVHDRGPENARLLATARGRTAYLLDERAGTFTELAR